mmetsp:Transcript_65527/g.192169  ORF Transcript_65527/g.192169 Transcript_65527/m.192169 type:complete len:245 (+) Transcript_65527:782-1516(+)
MPEDSAGAHLRRPYQQDDACLQGRGWRGPVHALLDPREGPRPGPAAPGRQPEQVHGPHRPPRADLRHRGGLPGPVRLHLRRRRPHGEPVAHRPPARRERQRHGRFRRGALREAPGRGRGGRVLLRHEGLLLLLADPLPGREHDEGPRSRREDPGGGDPVPDVRARLLPDAAGGQEHDERGQEVQVRRDGRGRRQDRLRRPRAPLHQPPPRLRGRPGADQAGHGGHEEARARAHREGRDAEAAHE